MTSTPIDFDQIQAQVQIVDNWGQSTPEYQALWQRMTGRVSTEIGRIDQNVTDVASATAAAASAASAAGAAATTATAAATAASTASTQALAASSAAGAAATAATAASTAAGTASTQALAASSAAGTASTQALAASTAASAASAAGLLQTVTTTGVGGTTTESPNASGDIAITHGYVDPSGGSYPATLKYCRVFASGTTYFHPQLISVTSTTLTVRLFDAAGVALPAGGSFLVTWHVGGA